MQVQSGQTKRDLSLDAFRGITVMLMILVNLQGNDDAAFAFIKHAEWNGLTLADLVFPSFLFIVGLSVPLALDRPRQGLPWGPVIKRALVLFFLGVLLSWLIRPVDFDRIRWMGVLQRIGIVYFGCAAVALMGKGWRLAAGLALGILAIHSLLILTVAAPGEAHPGLGPGEGLTGWLDRATLPGRLLRKTWDPEGVLSTFPAIANGLIGLALMRWQKLRPGDAGNAIIGIGFAMGVAGLISALAVPVNKQLWTASFVLITCGVGAVIWSLMSRNWARIGQSAMARLAVLLGQTALTFYVIHMLLLSVIVLHVRDGGLHLKDGPRLWELLYQALANIGLNGAIASMLFAIIAGALCVAPLGWLKRKGWLIRA